MLLLSEIKKKWYEGCEVYLAVCKLHIVQSFMQTFQVMAPRRIMVGNEVLVLHTLSSFRVS